MKVKDTQQKFGVFLIIFVIINGTAMVFSSLMSPKATYLMLLFFSLLAGIYLVLVGTSKE